MNRRFLVVLTALLTVPTATAAIPGFAPGWAVWEHEDPAGKAFSCRGIATVTGLRNTIPYGTLTLAFSFQVRTFPTQSDACARTPQAAPPTAIAWTNATQDDTGRITATRVDPCITSTITLEPGWSGAFHYLTVERARACFGPVTDTFRGVVG